MWRNTGLLILSSIVLLSSVPASAAKPQPLKAQVRFLARSTSVRAGWGGRSQEVFLVEVQLPRSDSSPMLAKLLDEYPAYRMPISREVLTSTLGTTLRILRDTSCDVAAGKMVLRAAPADPRAFLLQKMVFQPQLQQPLNPDGILPCYRVAGS